VPILELPEVPVEVDSGELTASSGRSHQEQPGQRVEELEEPVGMTRVAQTPQLFDKAEHRLKGIPPPGQEVRRDPGDGGSGSCQQRSSLKLSVASRNAPLRHLQAQDVCHPRGPGVHKHPTQELHPVEAAVAREADAPVRGEVEEGEGTGVLGTGQASTICMA
jgi:hypothetical protein